VKPRNLYEFIQISPQGRDDIGCLFEWNPEISMTLYRSLHYSRDDIRLSFRVEPKNLYDFIQISPQDRDDIRLSFRVEPKNLYDFIQISPQGRDDIRLFLREKEEDLNFLILFW
jgi:DNA-directed RNA polymerase subunit F